MTGTVNETVLARERLHPAIFVVPVSVAVATALPTLLMLLMIHPITGLISQVIHQQVRLLDGYSYLLFFLPAILCTLPVLAIALFAYFKSTITLTNRRLTYRTGLMKIQSGEVPLENVDAVFTENALPDRWLGFGTVIVEGVGGLRLPFHYLRAPGHFYRALNKAVTRAKA